MIFFAAKDGGTLYKTKQADCGSDHELLIANFILKLKKVGKTTRPLGSGLSQIPYTVDKSPIQIPYTVDVTNRFKGLNLIDRVPEEQWTEVPDIVQEARSKPIPKKKKCKNQNGCLRMPYK